MDGDGVRYFDSMGGSVRINYSGYPEKAEIGDVHGGPYVTITKGSLPTRIPLGAVLE
jgi:hypothetical protein